MIRRLFFYDLNAGLDSADFEVLWKDVCIFADKSELG